MGCDPVVGFRAPDNIPIQSDDDNDAIDVTDDNRLYAESKWDIDDDNKSPIAEGTQIFAMSPTGEWLPASIIKVQENRIFIHYEGSPSMREWIPINSRRLAPYRSMAHPGVRNLELQPGQKIEAKYRDQEWKEAVVVDIINKNVHVRYAGLDTDHDEVIPCSSERICAYGKSAGSAHLSGKIARKSSVNPAHDHCRVIQTQNPQYQQYCTALLRQGLRIFEVEGDGNCLFRSVSHQVYGDDKHHALVRARCMDYMESEKEYFEPYVVGDMSDFLRYIELKRRNAVWGDDPEIQALCELYDRPAEVFAYDSKYGARKLRTFHENRGIYRNRPVIRLSYYGGGHYDSICGDDHIANLIREPVGVIEERSIQYSRRKNSRLMADAEEKMQDKQAIEMAQIEAILKLSREEFDNQNDNLEESLKTSLLFLENEELKQAAHESDLIAVQAEMIQTAKQHSEEEQMKKALEESLRSACAMANSDNDLNDALKASLDESEYIYDADLQRALQMSTTCQHNSFTSTAFHGNELDEDEELQRAIQESLRQ